MITVGIISSGYHQQLYYLIKSIRKNFGNDYHIHLFAKPDDMLYNIVDNLTKHDNVDDPYDWMIKHCEGKILILKENCLLYNHINLDDYTKPRGQCIGTDMYYFGDTLPIGNSAQWRARLDAEMKEMVYEFPMDNPDEFTIKDEYIDFLYQNDIAWKHDYYDLIIGMTNWAGRINHDAFYECLDRLLKQKCKYSYKIVICLSELELGKVIPERLASYVGEDFEILWTWENTKPLKKYDPINAKYPELPIMTLDDDDMCDEYAVQYMYETHMRDPWAAYGTSIEGGPGLCKWIADLRIFPPHCMYPLPLSDYYVFFNGILDDNFNQIRCLFKMTPVRLATTPHSWKRNDDKKLMLTWQYQDFDWDAAYTGIIDAHYEELPEDLFYD